MQRGKFSIYRLTVIGVLSALAYVSNYFSIPIGDVTRIHLGNGFCVLAGLLLGPIAGGLAGGIGAFFYDLTNPLYASQAVITFALKFVIGFVAGGIAHSFGREGKQKRWNLIGAIAGSSAYVILYLLKNLITDFFFYRLANETILVKLATRSVSSLTNAVGAVVISMLLAPVFVVAMKRAGIYQKLQESQQAKE